jgi:MFS family permease
VYAVNDSVPWDYGAVLIVAGFIATLLGQSVVSWLVRRLGRPSVLVIILAAMFAASAAAAAAVVGAAGRALARDPSLLGATKGVCPTFH